MNGIVQQMQVGRRQLMVHQETDPLRPKSLCQLGCRRREQCPQFNQLEQMFLQMGLRAIVTTCGLYREEPTKQESSR